MRARCVVYGCKSASYNKLGYTLLFHVFPRDLVRREIWMKACKNPKLERRDLNTSVICGLHFEKKYYRNNVLKGDAVPTLNLPEAGFSFYDKKQKKTIHSTSSKRTLGSNDDNSEYTAYSENSMPTKTKSKDNNNIKSDKEVTRSDCGDITPTGTGSSAYKDEDSIENELQRVFNGNNIATVAKVYDDDDIESVTFSSNEDEDGSEEGVEITFKEEVEEDSTADDTESQLHEPNTLSSDSDNQALSKISKAKTDFQKILPEISDFQTILPKITKVTTDFQTSLPRISEVKSQASRTIEISPLTPTLASQPRMETVGPLIDMTMENDEKEDDCSTFAAHIKSRMRCFNREQKFIAQKLISDVMFMASTNQLQLGSAVVNPAPVMFMTSGTANQLQRASITTPGPVLPFPVRTVDKSKVPASKSSRLVSEDGSPATKRGKWQLHNAYLT